MNFDRFGFKAISKSTGTWAFVRMAASGFGCYGIRWSDSRAEDYDGCHIYPETLCQCTGLRDSDGRLIYENDILEIETPHGKDNGVVYYQELDASFRVWQEAFTQGLALVIEFTRTMDWKVKVIGNKFDKEEK